MEKKEYRSAVRSRRLIRSAFLELLEEKTLEKITVTDIVKQADINRSTFYAHYPDVQGLVDEIVWEAVEQTFSLMDAMDYRTFFRDPLPLLRQIVAPLEQNRDIYRLLIRARQAYPQMERLKQRLISETLRLLGITRDTPHYTFLTIRVRFSVGGMLDVATQWLRGELDCTLDEIAEHIAGIILRSARDAEVQGFLE